MTKWSQITHRVNRISALNELVLTLPSKKAELKLELENLKIDLDDYMVNFNRDNGVI